MEIEKLVIIGAGPAGYTAAIYAARANLNPLLIAGTEPGGLLMKTTTVENFPGFPDGILGPDLMVQMQTQAEKFGARVNYEAVASVQFESGGTQQLKLSDGSEIAARTVIIATGAAPRYPDAPSAAKFLNHGLSGCATCDGAFYPKVPVAVIGGGDSALEEAMFLTHFASHVYVIHRRDKLRATPIMVERANANGLIEFIWDSVVEEFLGDVELAALRIRNLKTGKISELPCNGCFPAMGHIPNTALFRSQIRCDETGFIILGGRHSSATSVRGVFAAGDCCDPRYRQAITAAGLGCCAAMDAERYLQ